MLAKATLLDLVRTVGSVTEDDREVVATVAYLINSGKVRLCGNFAGAKIDLSPDLPATASECSSEQRPDSPSV